MTTTPNLALPYILAAQAQKHVTHNEAIRALDALVQPGVVDRDLAAPPASPADGARFIVAAPATGAWTGHEDHLAAWQDGAWMFYEPKPGWLVWVADEARLVVWSGIAWSLAEGGEPALNPVPLVGINTTADTTNRLAVASPASLFTHEGAGHQQKIDKATAGDTASVLLQTGFSGRAEIGTTGDDDLHVKVSPDGTTWHEALHVDRASGRTVFHQLAQWLGDAMTGLVAWRYVPPSPPEGAPGAPMFNVSFGEHEWSNGPPEEPDYTNYTAHMGFNVVDDVRQDSNLAGLGLSWESRYFQNGRFISEFHLQGYTTDGTKHRWLTALLPQDTHAGAYFGLNVDVFNLNNVAMEQKVKFDLAAGAISLYGMTLFAVSNNLPALKQLNAAGTTYLSLPYIDQYDRMLIGAPAYVSTASGDAQFGAALPINFASPVNGSKVIYAQSGNVTGNLFAFDFGNLKATGSVIGFLRNTTAGGHAALEISNAPGTGDTLLRFTPGYEGVANYALGVDQSAAEFQICKATTLGGSKRLALNDSRASWSVPVGLPSYTVAGLPAASAAGAGALCYVSNASGGPTLACSDGSAWKIVAALGATVS